MKMYHTTSPERLDSILLNGLKINSTPNKSIGSLEYMAEAYKGIYPIFLSIKPGAYKNGIVLEIDVSGLPLVSDIPSLIEHDGHLSEDSKHIWWDEYVDDPKAQLIYEMIDENGEVEISKLIKPNSYESNKSIEITETCAVMQNIEPERIKMFGNIDKRGTLIKEFIDALIKEEINLDISVGDVVLAGKFKNKRVVVKSIGKDDNGQPTINGKALLNVRIEKDLPKEKQSKETRESLKEFISKEIKLIFESKQNIMNLGLPEVIASIFYEVYGKNAYIVAKWYKDNFSYQFTRGGETNMPQDWWKKSNISYSLRKDTLDVVDLVNLYEAAQHSEEAYRAMQRELELESDNVFDKEEILSDLRPEIKEKLFKERIFFGSDLIKDIQNGKLTDLAPYKKLSYDDAKDKYDKKKIFSDVEPIKTYSNGFKWINAGSSCQLVGKQMKNCGSTGVMSMDKDRTMIVLFDKNNKPHVVTTYSPNENRLSGDEGAASTAVKEEYHDYILDLAKTLGARFDSERTKSPVLRLKSAFGGHLLGMEELYKTSYHTYYKLKMNDGISYVTDSMIYIPESEVERIKQEQNIESYNDAVRETFKEQNSYNNSVKSSNFYGMMAKYPIK